MSYQQIADEAVQSSIRSVLIFDDEYVDLCDYFNQGTRQFAQPTGEMVDQVEDSARICRSFTASHMAYRIVRFDQPRRGGESAYLEDVMRRVEAVDLLVLDWQLEPRARNRGVFASQLIQGIVGGQLLSWVYVYTHDEHRKPVADKIYAVLSGRRIKSVSRLVASNMRLRFLKNQLLAEMRLAHGDGRNPWYGVGVGDLAAVMFDPQVVAPWLQMDEDELRETGVAVARCIHDSDVEWKQALTLFAREVILDELAHGVRRLSCSDLPDEPSIRPTKDADGVMDAYDVLAGGLTIMVRFKGAAGDTSPENLATGITRCVRKETESIVSTMSLILGNSIRRSLPSIRKRFKPEHDLAALMQIALDPGGRADPSYLLVGRALDQVFERIRRWHGEGRLVPKEIWRDYLADNSTNMRTLRGFRENVGVDRDSIRRLHAVCKALGLPTAADDFWGNPDNRAQMTRWVADLVARLDKCALGEAVTFDRLVSPDELLDDQQAEIWRRAVLQWVLLGKADRVETPYRIAAAELNAYLNALDYSEPERLAFGHALRDSSDGAYYLCITAPCDCARPEENLPEVQLSGRGARTCYYYSFVQGKKVDDAKLKQVFDELTKEKHAYSFLLPADGQVLVVDWAKAIKGVPVVPDYEVSGEGAHRELSVAIGNRKSKLVFVQQIRQQFAQQVANRAAANLARVGVDWTRM